INTGQPWQSLDGLTWLNPLADELWQAYADFAAELVQLGFDEVQFDYVRFPSDGDMTTLDFGEPVDETIQCRAIANFLGACRDRVASLGAATAADIFGYTMLVDDIGIGQNAALLAPQADTLCPMLYPSHYPDASILVPGTPNDYPYEVVAISLADGATRVPPAQLRPWLQDFSLAGMSPYGPAQVRAQIDAAEAAGAAGWMLWAADSVYTVEALANG
ncbi:MAG: putative glycoside hydrolase, partial [Thermomicrobiales bacterium]